MLPFSPVKIVKLISVLSKTLGGENRCNQSCRLSDTLPGKVSCPSSRYHFNKGI